MAFMRKPVSLPARIFLAFLGTLLPAFAAAGAESLDPIEKSTRVWKEILTAEEFNILRQEGTERPYSSDLLEEKRSGVYTCAGCDLPLFASLTKYESGTGWPSFWAPLSPDRVGFKEDRKLWAVRTEVHCIRCQGHLGHVFKDGPQPTGLRYCLNGVALDFVPMEKSEIPQGKPTITRKDI